MSDATVRRLSHDLLALGARRGGVLLMHSSLSSLGHVPGGPEAVIRGLLEAIGPGGTLLLPALSYASVSARQPCFDVQSTPSNVGAIPEHFRRRPGTTRSLHPTHSVCAVGPLTEEILGEHHRDRTPVGEHSPFRRVRDLGGQLLFLGCGLRPNTSMHGVEELVEPPYLFGDDVTYHLTDANGETHEVTHRHHGFGIWRQRYDRAEPLLERGTEISVGAVLEAKAYLIESRALWDRTRVALERDPMHFVERGE